MKKCPTATNIEKTYFSIFLSRSLSIIKHKTTVFELTKEINHIQVEVWICLFQVKDFKYENVFVTSLSLHQSRPGLWKNGEIKPNFWLSWKPFPNHPTVTCGNTVVIQRPWGKHTNHCFFKRCCEQNHDYIKFKEAKE